MEVGDLSELLTGILLEAEFASMYGDFAWYFSPEDTILREVHVWSLTHEAAQARLASIVEARAAVEVNDDP